MPTNLGKVNAQHLLVIGAVIPVCHTDESHGRVRERRSIITLCVSITYYETADEFACRSLAESKQLQEAVAVGIDVVVLHALERVVLQKKKKKKKNNVIAQYAKLRLDFEFSHLLHHTLRTRVGDGLPRGSGHAWPLIHRLHRRGRRQHVDCLLHHSRTLLCWDEFLPSGQRELVAS